MSQHTYVIADLHLGHKKIIEFEPLRSHWATIEDHDRAIIERWNSIVRKKDSVWVLGDVFFGGKGNHAILEPLLGIKRLILGNHDHYPLEVYQKYFSRILGVTEYHGCVMTHVPVHPYQLDKRYKLNIHGHSHSKRLADPRYVCVSVEQTDFYPMRLNEIIERGLAASGRDADGPGADGHRGTPDSSPRA